MHLNTTGTVKQEHATKKYFTLSFTDLHEIHCFATVVEAVFKTFESWITDSKKEKLEASFRSSGSL